MPNHVNFYPKAGGTKADFVAIDEELCELLGKEIHPKHWVNNWYNCIAFDLACGSSFDKLRGHYARYDDPEDKEMIKIIDYLDDNYTFLAWATR